MILDGRTGPGDQGGNISERGQRAGLTEPGEEGVRVPGEGLDILFVGSHEDEKLVGARERNQQAREAIKAGDAVRSALLNGSPERQSET